MSGNQVREWDLLAKQVAELAGVPAPTFGHWLATGLIRPVRVWGRGRGRRYQFSLTNLVEVMAVTHLRKRRIAKDRLYCVVDELERNRQLVEGEEGMLTLVTDGKQMAKILVGEHDLADFIRHFGGGGLFAVPLDEFRDKALEWVESQRLADQPSLFSLSGGDNSDV